MQVTRKRRWSRGSVAHALISLVLLTGASCAERDESAFILPLGKEPGRSLAARVTFNGQTAWFMFDTGAGAHTLARWFVDAAGIPFADSLSGGVRALDATGQLIGVRVVGRQTGWLPNGRSLILESAIVADFPPDIRKSEVGGLLNPQLLASTNHAVVLDLRVPELRVEPFDDAVRRLGAHVLAGNQFQRCVDKETPVPNLVFSVLVSAGDENNGWLQFDTGARVTSIAASSQLVDSVELIPGGETMGIAGRSQTHSTAPDLTISFGDHRATVDAQIVQRTHGGCGSDGLLGRDALGKCALVLSRDSVAIACDS